MSNKIQIFHNPRCSKSREALNILTENNIDIEVVEYLNTDLTTKDIKDLLIKLNISASDLLRKGETDYKENIKGKDLSDEEIIALMIKFPKLIERPIVINGDKAVIGRPPSLVNSLF
jgi:arsenate reductase (glutaredoxin)